MLVFMPLKTEFSRDAVSLIFLFPFFFSLLFSPFFFLKYNWMSQDLKSYPE